MKIENRLRPKSLDMLYIINKKLKIKKIAVSNILSFENNEDHASIEPIIFNNDLSILIGPNGSGKSNFLEVISKLFTNILIKDCVFNEQNLRDYDHGIINKI